MPKQSQTGRGTNRANNGPRGGRGRGNGNGGTRGGPRKKLALDILLEHDTNHLLKGYNSDQLNDLHSKVFDLTQDICHALDYGGEVAEVIGAKLDNKAMFFYVKWEDGSHSFVPSTILNRIAPEKVIQYYESILSFQPPSDTPTDRGLEKLLKNDTIAMETIVNKMLEQESLEKKKAPEPSRFDPPSGNDTKGGANFTSPAQKNFRTMNCTGCAILLQYPEGTKAIKCPVCNTVMHAK